MTPVDFERDEQDQSEVFDETHLDDEGDGELLLDELDDVLDVTQAEGDGDEDEPAEAEASLPDDLDAEDEDDALQTADEVELVYAGLMRNQRGAQASAAHWEARALADDDIEDLGYGPDDSAEDDPFDIPSPEARS